MTTYSPPNPSAKEKVSAFYASVFNRAPDKSGLDYWVSSINQSPSQSATYLQLATGFTQHVAFTDLYGTNIQDSDVTKTTFINALYTNMLGANGDAQGVAYWVGLLGTASVAEVVSSFIQSALSVDLSSTEFDYLSAGERALAESRQATITNKAQVGVYFAEQMDDLSDLLEATDPASDLYTLLADPRFLASYILTATVTDDPDTVDAAKALVDLSLLQSDPVAFFNAYAPQAGLTVNSYDGLLSTSGVQPLYADVADIYEAGIEYIRGSLSTIETIDTSDEDQKVTFNFGSGVISGVSGANVADISYLAFDAFKAGRLGSEVTLSATDYDEVNKISTSKQAVYGGDGFDKVVIDTELALLGTADDAIELIEISSTYADISRLNSGLITGADEITLVGNDSSVRMTATQTSDLDDVNAAGNDNTITIATGNINSIYVFNEIESYTVEDDLLNDEYAIYLSNQDTNFALNLDGSDDVVTLEADNDDETESSGTITVTGLAPNLYVNGLGGDLDLSNFDGTVNVNVLQDDSFDAFEVWTGSNDTTVNGTEDNDSVYINADELSDATLTLSGDADVTVDGVQSSITIDASNFNNLDGTLNVSTFDNDSSDVITIITGDEDTSVDGADASDTIVINADDMNIDTTLILSGDSAVTVNDVSFDLTIDADSYDVNDASDDSILNASLVVNFNDNASFNLDLYAGLGDTTLNTGFSGEDSNAADIYAQDMSDGSTLTLSGDADFDVYDVQSSITIDAESVLNDDVRVTTVDDSDADDITIIAGAADLYVNGEDASDTVTIDAGAMLDGEDIDLTGYADVTIDGVDASIRIDAYDGSSDNLSGDLVINMVDDSDADTITIEAGTGDTIVNAVDASDDVIININNTQDADILTDVVINHAELVITGAANVVVNDLNADMGINADGSEPGAIFTGTLVINIDDDNNNDTYGIGLGSGDSTINSTDDNDFLLINTGSMGSDSTLDLNGDGELAFITNIDVPSTVPSLISELAQLGTDATTIEALDGLFNSILPFESNSYTIDASDFTGAVNISLFADGSSDAYTIVTGDNTSGFDNFTRVVVRESLDTATIDVSAIDNDVENISDATALDLAGAADMSVDGVQSDMVISANGLGLLFALDTLGEGGLGNLVGLGEISDDDLALMQDFFGLNGTLDVSTVDDNSDDSILIYSGSNDTTVNAVDSSDDVEIYVNNMLDGKSLDLSGDSYFDVYDVQSSITIDAALTTDTVHVHMVDDSDSDDIVINAGGDFLFVDGEDGSDTVTIHADAMVDATIGEDSVIDLNGYASVTVDGVQSSIEIDAYDLDETLVVNTVDDSDADSISIFTGNNDTTVNALDDSDDITVDVGQMENGDTLILSGESAVTVNEVYADMTIDADSFATNGESDDSILNGTLVVNIGEDYTNTDVYIYTGTNDLFVNAGEDSGDDIEIFAEDMSDGASITLTGNADTWVYDVQSSITIDAQQTQNDLDIYMVDDSDADQITILAGSDDDLYVNGEDALDTLTIHADMSNGESMSLDVLANVTVEGVQSSMSIYADDVFGTLEVSTSDDVAFDNIYIYTGNNDTTVNALDSSDGVYIDVDQMSDASMLTLSGVSEIDVFGVESSITIDADAFLGNELSVSLQEDDDSDDITIMAGAGAGLLHVNGEDTSDTVTIQADAMADATIGEDSEINLDGYASVTVDGVQSSIVIDAYDLDDTLDVNMIDDNDADNILIRTGSNDTTVDESDAADTVTIDAYYMLNSSTLTVTGESDNQITDLRASLVDTSTGVSHIYLDAQDNDRAQMTIDLGESTTDGKDVLILSNTLEDGDTNFLEIRGFDAGNNKDALIITNALGATDLSYTDSDGTPAGEDIFYDTGAIEFSAGFKNDFDTGISSDLTGLISGSVIEIDASTFTLANYQNLDAMRSELATIDNVASGAEFLVVVYSGNDADSNAYIYHVYSDRQGDGFDFADNDLDASGGPLSFYDEFAEGNDLNGDAALSSLYEAEFIDESSHDAIELVGIIYGIGSNTMTAQNFFSDALINQQP